MARIRETLARQEAGGDSEIDSSAQMGGPREEFQVRSLGEVIGRKTGVPVWMGVQTISLVFHRESMRCQYPCGDMGPKPRRGAGLEEEKAGQPSGSHLPVQVQAEDLGEKDQENHVGRHGGGG